MPSFAKQNSTPLKRGDSLKQSSVPGKPKLNRHEIARLAAAYPDEAVAGAPNAEIPIVQEPAPLLGIEDADYLGKPGSISTPRKSSRSISASTKRNLNSGEVKTTPATDAKRTTIATESLDPLMIMHADSNRPAPALSGVVPSVIAAPPSTSAGPKVVTADLMDHPEVQESSAMALNPNQKGDTSSSDEICSSSPATGAFRDLSTGAVVETDNEGNPAEPTSHPSIRSLDNSANATPEKPKSVPVSEHDEIPGLKAAAQFLDRDKVSTTNGYPDSQEDHRPNAPRNSTQEEDCRLSGTFHDMGPQVTGFAIASSKRNDDFHALFPSVPEDDFLIESYGCAISRDLLIQGRMYVSEGSVCFYSSIFGWVTSAVVPFADIVSIEKRNTAYLIPNAILIRTLQSKYLFSSFVTRDSTYSMLVNIWRLSQPSASAQEHAAAAEGSNEMQSDDEKELAKESNGRCISKREKLRRRLAIARHQAKNQESGSVEAANTSVGDAPLSSTDGDLSDSSQDSDDEEDEEQVTTHAPTKCNCDAKKEHFPNVVYEGSFDVTPKKLFNILFCDDFMESFLSNNQHLSDVKVGEWKDKGGVNGVSAARDVTYVKPLSGPIGPKQTRCEIVEEQLHIDFDDCCTTKTTTRTPDVPSGSSFNVQTRTCFMWGDNGHAKMFVTCAVEWTGRSMIKSIVDKASIDGQKQYYADLARAIEQLIEESSKNGRAQKSKQTAGPVLVADGSAQDGVSKAPLRTMVEVPVSPSAGTPATTSAAKDLVAKPSSEPASIWEKAQQMVERGAETLNTRPTVLLLGLLIVLLFISNVAVYFRSTQPALRQSSKTHSLLNSRGTSPIQPLNMRHAALLIDEQVQETLQLLERSRHLTEAFELEIKELRDSIYAQTQEYRQRIDAHQ
ncbi:hypothetical protein MYAM1_001613 [Malassezia yamatoensis]|uniref:VASt domain-containing protein n=1 Tax=Malassezia yamatoensis TaxID=253288 RepID=A0AAJ5YRN3_9BASI|nr:hypothetical protein MYAM1_001613 [Malassezia yamatoensis]